MTQVCGRNEIDNYPVRRLTGAAETRLVRNGVHREPLMLQRFSHSCVDMLAKTRNRGSWRRFQHQWHNPGTHSRHRLCLRPHPPAYREIEHHFRLEGQRRFRNLMAGYLALLTRVQYAGSKLRSRVPFVSHSDAQPTAAVNLASFTHECIRVAGERSLDQRHKALRHRLLVEVHPNPERALSDGAQSLYPEQFERLMRETRIIVEAIGRRVAEPAGARA